MKCRSIKENGDFCLIVENPQIENIDNIKHAFFVAEGSNYKKCYSLSEMGNELTDSQVMQIASNFERLGPDMFKGDFDFSKVLSKLAEQLNNAEVKWYLIGSGSDSIRGIDVNPHDIDLVVHTDDFFKVANLFSDYVVEPFVDNKGEWVVRYFGRIVIDGAMIDVAADLSMNAESKYYEMIKWNGFEVLVESFIERYQTEISRERIERISAFESYLRAGISHEEDIFPQTFSNLEKRDFGLLFANHNKGSYDSNHAVISGINNPNLQSSLDDITKYYLESGVNPSIYQATRDEGYIVTNKSIFEAANYEVWIEDDANFMILSGENTLKGEHDTEVKELLEWSSSIEENIFIPAEEEYEIEVFKTLIDNDEAKVFGAFVKGEIVAIMSLHQGEVVTRFDYILVAPKFRKMGIARHLLSDVVEYCKENNYRICYQWPAHKTSERLCYDVGFRTLFKAETVRAVYKGEINEEDKA